VKNPIGPYPGRQLFLGKTLKGDPCFAYLITGRSPESRQRKAVRVGDVIRIGPLGDQPYDPLRHYNAVKFDTASGLLSLSNGIQTDAGFEMYKLLYNTASVPSDDYLAKILEGAGAEPDSYHTPRIAGVITFQDKKPVWIIGIKSLKAYAVAARLETVPGKLIGVSTYQGSLDNPVATDPAAVLPVLDIKADNAEELGNFVFDISAASYKDNDIRVCCLSGVFSSGGWNFFVRNVQS
jgi:IMP cyclohydrolase